MNEELKALTVVAGAVPTFFVDQSQPISAKFVIPRRENFEVGEKVEVYWGNVLVGYHDYREGDYFDLHIAALLAALYQVQGTTELYYTITHLDGTKSTAAGIRSKLEMYDGKSSITLSSIS